MKRMGWLVLLSLVLIAGYFLLGPRATPRLSTAKVTEKTEIPAKSPADPTPIKNPPATVPETLPEPHNQRDRKVLAQLKTFIERTQNITAESVGVERERIQQKLAEVNARVTETPRSQLITDEQGERWERLEFKDGLVRYVPVARKEATP